MTFFFAFFVFVFGLYSENDTFVNLTQQDFKKESKLKASCSGCSPLSIHSTISPLKLMEVLQNKWFLVDSPDHFKAFFVTATIHFSSSVNKQW